MLEINTSKLKTRKKVLIDGHPFTVRRMGNIEQLDLSQHMRRLNRLAEAEKVKPLDEQELAEVDALTSVVMDLFIGLFDDGGDQTKSRHLLASLSDTEISLLIAQIFEEKDESPAVS